METLNTHIHPEMMKHLGKSWTINRANNNGDHVIVDVLQEGYFRSVMCWSHGYRIKHMGKFFLVSGTTCGQFSTLARAIACAKLKSTGMDDVHASYAAVKAA